MEIILDPETYYPMVDNDGSYIDLCPYFIENGIRCPCGTRTEHVYNSKLKFKQHINCVKHKKWIEMLNREKHNYYKENIELQDTINEQKKIICKLQQELTKLEILNKYLDSKIVISKHNNHNSDIVNDLLEFT